MKICFVTTNFPRHLGDSEVPFILDMVQAVSRHGHQVRVIAQHWPGVPTREWMVGIEVVRPRYWWPESWEILRRPGGGLPIVWKKSWLARLQMIPFIIVHTLAVARHARDCDVIHAQWTLSAGAAWLSRVVHGRPILATLQGSDVFQVTRSRIGAWLTRLVLRRCDRISVLSQALARSTAAIGIPVGEIQIIPNGVDLEKFAPPTDAREPLIVYVGSLIKRKGVVYLLEAMAQVLQVHPHFRLAIVGDGVERLALEKIAADLNIENRVTFAGQLPPQQVREWMRRARVFVLPSVEEGLGVVLLEALACGTPIVASRVGGICDVVTPEVGVLVPPANSDRLAEGIDHLLGDEETWAKMSGSARQRAEEHYCWDRITDQYTSIYESLVTNRG